MTVTVIHAPSYEAWVANGGAYSTFINMLKDHDMKDVTYMRPREASAIELTRVHDPQYVQSVMDGWSDEWTGARKDLAKLAALFAGGTIRGAEMLWRGTARRVFHAAGGQQHATAAASSMFSVFNDVALAASWMTRRGLKVACVSIDAIYADGVASLLRGVPGAATVSLYDADAIPARGQRIEPRDILSNTYAYAMPQDATDDDLDDAISYAGDILRFFGPDVLMVAAGASGCDDDGMSSLNYTVDGFYNAGHRFAQLADEICNGRLLVTGASGRCPDTWTPMCWTAFLQGVDLPAPATAVTSVERANLRLVK